MRRLLVRFGATLCIVCVPLGTGLYVGYQVGRILALHRAADRLTIAARLVLNDSLAFSRDAYAALKGMKASPYPPCSQQDLELLRSLLQNSHLLRELGRTRNNRVACSTANDRQDAPAAEFPQPYSVGENGVRIYRNPPAFAIPDAVVTVYGSRDAFVVLNPFINALRPWGPEHIVVAVLGPNETRPFPLDRYSTRPTMKQLDTAGHYRIGEIQYSTICSQAALRCITAALSDDEALLLDQPEVHTYAVFGAILGGVVGFFVVLLYRRSRSVDYQLRRAIAKDRVRLLYQPIVELATQRIVGAEALARWTNEHGEEVRPDIFVGIAEKHGYVPRLTRRVIQRALRELGPVFRRWPGFRVSINITASDLACDALLPTLSSALRENAVAPETVVLEITESSTADHQIAIECIRKLRKAGHQVHIDDFGTGYSSLSYLQCLSVDAIKVDRVFTQSIGTGSVTSAILRPILSMAEGLHLHVVAEGIETEEQAAYFAKSGLNVFGQGYLFARPMTAEELQHVLAEEERLKDGDQQAERDDVGCKQIP